MRLSLSTPHRSVPRRLALWGALVYSVLALPAPPTAANQALANQASRTPVAGAAAGIAVGVDREPVTHVRPIAVRQILESGANMKAVDDVVYVSGTIDPDQDVRLREMALLMVRGGMVPSLVVFLANEGGHLGAAMRMGRLIRQLGVSTAVADTCASACIYAFAGGSRRFGTPDSHFGLHPARRADGRGGTVAEDEQVAVMRYEYLDEMGVDPYLVTWEGELLPHQVHWMTAEEAREARLTNLLLAAEEIPLPPGD